MTKIRSQRKRSWMLWLLQHRMRRRIVLAGVVLVCLLLLSFCFRKPKALTPAKPETVWSYIQEKAPEYDLEPRFVYAIAMAESSLDPVADSGYARGIMQMSAVAWEEVAGDVSYRQAWNWKTNIDMALRYLDHCRQFLIRENGSWSYALLAASYRYGIYRVKDANFKISNLPRPKNEIYQKIFLGNPSPVLPVE